MGLPDKRKMSGLKNIRKSRYFIFSIKLSSFIECIEEETEEEVELSKAEVLSLKKVKYMLNFLYFICN
jgi:hypothetical protein